MKQSLALLNQIRARIHDYSSMISAADMMPSIDFGPKFSKCTADIHQLVDRLSPGFRREHHELVKLLLKDDYHFVWSEIEDSIERIVGSEET